MGRKETMSSVITSSYPVDVTRGWMTRTDAIERTLALLRFFEFSNGCL